MDCRDRLSLQTSFASLCGPQKMRDLYKITSTNVYISTKLQCGFYIYSRTVEDAGPYGGTNPHSRKFPFISSKVNTVAVLCKEILDMERTAVYNKIKQKALAGFTLG